MIGLEEDDEFLEDENLGVVHFEDTDQTGEDFRDEDLRGARFEGADLTDAHFEDSDLTHAHFEGADLIDAHLQDADLTRANLTGADLTGANFTGATLTRVIGANFAGAIGVNVHQGIAHQVHPVIAHQGIAYQVHNAFNSLNIVNFMAIIRDNITPNRIEGKLLEKLIAYSKKHLPAKTEDLIRINATIKTYGGKNGNDVQDVITFVLLQPVPFKQMYITNFTDDCLNAYNVGNRESCVKGQYERVFMNLEGVIGFTCNEDETGCPPVYKELLACFKPDYTKLFGDWFALGQDADAQTNYQKKSPKEKEAYVNAKKADFKAYVFEQIGNRHDIDEYIDAEFLSFYTTIYNDTGEGKRKTNKRKTKNKNRKTKNKNRKTKNEKRKTKNKNRKTKNKK